MSEIETMLRRAAAGLPVAAPDVRERAEAEGLVDVAYAPVDSPLGPLVVAATPRGLVRVAYTDHSSADEVLEELAVRVSPRVLEAPGRLDPVRRELDEYFAGAAASSSRRSTGRTGRLHAQGPARDGAHRLRRHRHLPRASPRGAGSPRAVRAAGNALGANPMPVVVPCHRVLRTGGALGGYTGGIERKEFLLRLEGVLDSHAA